MFPQTLHGRQPQSTCPMTIQLKDTSALPSCRWSCRAWTVREQHAYFEPRQHPSFLGSSKMLTPSDNRKQSKELSDPILPHQSPLPIFSPYIINKTNGCLSTNDHPHSRTSLLSAFQCQKPPNVTHFYCGHKLCTLLIWPMSSQPAHFLFHPYYPPQ